MTPSIRTVDVYRENDCVLVRLNIYPPALRQVRIVKITCNGRGIALADASGKDRYGQSMARIAAVHGRCVRVDMELLPACVSVPEPTPLDLSIKLRKSKSTVRISCHMARSLFPVRHTITTVNSTKRD